MTPFYFLKAGLYVSLPEVAGGVGLIVALLSLKILAKFVGVLPMTRVFSMKPREGTYTMLLMSTGLTFGTISALFGLTNNIVDQDQYTILVTVVIGSAVVPTLIAQSFFRPDFGNVDMAEKAIPVDLTERDVLHDGSPATSQIHRRLDELVTYLRRDNEFPPGVILMTGAGIIPLSEFTLENGDVVEITIDSIGTLQNRVVRLSK